MRRKVKLSKVAKIDRTPASNKECEIMAYVGLEHIEKDSGHFTRNFSIKPDTLLASKYKFTSQHVLYGKLRPYLNKVVLPHFAGVCTTEILPILPDEQELDRTYLWAILLSKPFVAWATRSVAGANLPRLDPKLLANYEIPLPSPDEQKRIATILAKADRLRQLRRFALEMSSDYLQAVFLEMFGDPVTNPMGWEVEQLGNYLTRIDSGWSPVCDEQRSNSSQWAILKLGAVTWGEYNPEENKQLPANIQPRTKLEVTAGDLLFSRKNTIDLVGACTFVNSTPPKLMLPDTIFRFVFKNLQETYPEYIWALFNNTAFKKNIQLLATGSAGSMPNISKEKVKGIAIPLPQPLLQHQFAQIVRQYERLRTQQREALRQAEHLFQTLLHRAFAGEI